MFILVPYLPALVYSVLALCRRLKFLVLPLLHICVFPFSSCIPLTCLLAFPRPCVSFITRPWLSTPFVPGLQRLLGSTILAATLSVPCFPCPCLPNNAFSCHSVEENPGNASQTPRIIPNISLTSWSDYRLGRNIARTYLDYYRATGVIPANVPAPVAASPEPRRRARSSHSPSARPRSRPRTTRGKAVLHLHELTAADDRGGSSSSDGGEGSPIHLAPLSPQQNRRRSAVVLHYPELTASLPEPPVSAGLRSLAGRKIGGGVVCQPASRPQPSPPSPPRLAIIDFNKLTRGGLDQATGRGRGQCNRGRGKSKRRDSRKHGSSPEQNRL